MVNLAKLMLFISNNIWNILNFLGFLLALFGLILFFKSYRRKLPYFAIYSMNLINNFISTIDKLDIKFDGTNISSLTISKIAFWNAGKDTINNSDIPKTDPIKFILKEDYRILSDPVILFTNNPSNQFIIKRSLDNKYFTIDFDYIDKKNMVIIQLIHTGMGFNDFNISGTIKGVGKPIKIIKFKKMSWIEIFWLSIMVCSFILLNYNIISELIKGEYFDGHYIINIFFIGLFCLSLIFITIILIANLRYVLMKPKGFDIFEGYFKNI